MSRLDRHVAMVRNKLALARFVEAIGWASVVYVALVWLGIVVNRMFRLRLPHVSAWVWGGAGLAVLVAFVYALIRRPTRHDAAVAIDDRLELKEKFSTALYARALKDEFADAAVKDAERTADNVSLHRRFPLEFPRQGLGAIGIGILVVLTMAFLPQMDLFGRAESQRVAAEHSRRVEEARKAVEANLKVIVDSTAKAGVDDETIKQAKLDLQKMLQAPIRDPEKAKLTAARALSDVSEAIKQKIGDNQKIADAENDARAFKSISPPTDEKGPVADAQRKIAQGKFADAVEDLEKAVDKFDKMTEQEKQKAADQMNNMAKQLQAMANNPQVQQQVQQQLQQAGLNQQQAQQAQQLMQQAAQGNQQAAQQLAQLGQQAMKQMNNGQGPNQKQQQQMQNLMKQMQAQANTQAQAQQMAQAAQQMAGAMKQAAQGGQKGQAQQGQGGQQQAQAQMQQGQAAMKQQLGQMQAMKTDAQQVAAAQAAAAQAAADAAAGLNNNPGQNPGQGQGANQKGQPGQFANNQGKWNGQPGQGGGGVGAGDRTYKEAAPEGFKQVMSPSEDIEGGKILASSMIKASSNKGESHVSSQTVTAPPSQDATDEVEQDRISRPAQEAVKNYFSAWQKDAGNAPTAGGAPAQ